MKKIETIIRKEWAEVFKNRMVLFTVAFLPLLLTAIPLIMLYTMGSSIPADMSSDLGEMPAQVEAFCPGNVSGGECMQVYLISNFMLMFMMIPLVIPVTIASYSIVGEKTTRSLEPLLATPITTAELLIGKGIAAALPGIVATWFGFVVFAVGAGLMVKNPQMLSALLDARWLIAVFITGPLMAFSAVALCMMVSSRVSDPRVAEQISMIVIIPLLGMFFGQMAGVIIINRPVILIISAILLAIDVALGYFAVRVFQREAILTRWK
jgi:ABC-2 type transport system permease protein